MKKLLKFHQIVFIFILIFIQKKVSSQNFIPLWTAGKMPNSKGLKLKDSIANQRIYQVGEPGFYAFFPSRDENTGAAVVICPGGSYERLAYIVSGIEIAKWFSSIGVNAFVLNYRLPTSPDLIKKEIGSLSFHFNYCNFTNLEGQK